MVKTFEDFPVYMKSLGLIKEIDQLCKKIKGKELFFLKDQLKRAASSVVLNMAEGSGKWTKKDKGNFYRISRGSVYECLAAVDLMSAFGQFDAETTEALKKMLKAISEDLQKLIITVERRAK